MTKRDIAYCQKLEAQLGADLCTFWQRATGNTAPAVVLQELLADRSRAARAARFIKRHWPARWSHFGSGSS